MPGRLSIQQVRLLVLLLLIITVLVTAAAYLVGLQRRMAGESPPPPRVPPNVARSEGFSLSKSEQGRTLFTVKAARAREQKDTGRSLLEDVEITTYGAQGNRHDRISSKACEYDAKSGQVRSEGEVEMELASLPGELLQNEAAARGGSPALSGAVSRSGPIYVKTSGVTFDEKTGIVATDRAVEFRFARGSGRATGAVYDSNQRVLKLKAAVEIKATGAALEGTAPGGAVRRDAPLEPVEIRAAELVYAQRESQIRLDRLTLRRALPGGGLRQLSGDRGVLLLDAHNQVRNSEVTGNVRVQESVPAGPAHESGKRESRPNRARESRLAADRLEVLLKDQAVEQVYATGAVRFDSASPHSRTEATAGRLDLYFTGEDQALSRAQWKGNVRMVLTPAAAGADTRVLTSDAVEMTMTADGGDLRAARTLAPGRLELIPPARSASTDVGTGTRPASAAPAGARPARLAGRRVLTAGLISMDFGDTSQVRLLHAEQNVRLESEVRPASNGTSPGAPAPPPPPRVTTSEVLDAHFAPETQQLQTLRQTGGFRYAEGDRQAAADAADYNAERETVTLTGRPGRNPEVWDTETRTSARQIVLNDKTGEGTGEREVRSVHLPREPAAPGATKQARTVASVPGPLSDKDPVQVVAERMLSNSRTGVTRYEAGAGGSRVRLWQNNDVIEARVLVIERDQKRLTAEGQVTTVLLENSGGAPGALSRGGMARSAPAGRDEGGPRPLVVTAERLVYNDSERRARYERRVVLRRAGSTMTSASLDAYLLPPDEVKPGESRLRRAVARGNVQITESRADGERRAAAELAEYERAEEKMVLSGGEPYVYDEQRGYTRGRQLTYYMRDDRIFVHGDHASRAVTEQQVRRR